MDTETLTKIRKKIDGAYHDREDYPPYALAVWDDRARYHQYILSLINEEIEKALSTGFCESEDSQKITDSKSVIAEEKEDG